MRSSSSTISLVYLEHRLSLYIAGDNSMLKILWRWLETTLFQGYEAIANRVDESRFHPASEPSWRSMTLSAM
jgi:hypothetical protein